MTHPSILLGHAAWASRIALVCLLAATLLSGRASGEPYTPGVLLDQRMVAEVTGAALAFMAPRTLETVSTGQLTLWGLRGLTTLDSRIETGLAQRRLVLSQSGKVLHDRPAPADEDAAGWGEAVGELARSAWDASDAVRRTGTQGVLRSFFDELFAHLDPYSRYASPAEAAEEAERRNGRAGIGLEVSHDANGFAAGRVIQGGPAALAGIRPGDRLLAVDGQQLQGADLAAARALVAGPEDTAVDLQIRSQAGRGPDRSVRTISLTRVIVTPPTVFTRRDGDLLVMRITAFARDTPEVMTRELSLGLSQARPPRGLVLDLRDNRGGLLRQAVQIAADFMQRDVGSSKRIAATVGRDPLSIHEYRTEGSDLGRGLPVVVLVDGRTASSAEVLAAALSDQRRAVVVGSATLGKGLVQTILPLPDGGALSITWSRVVAPRGWPLQALGVLPQVCTSFGADVLRRSLAELAAGRQPLARPLTRHRDARAPLLPADILDIRSACPAGEGQDADLTAARFLVANAQAYAAALMPLRVTP